MTYRRTDGQLRRTGGQTRQKDGLTDRQTDR